MPFTEFDVEKTIEEEKQKDTKFHQLWDESRTEYDLIGELIKARKDANITQEELAERLNCKQQKISRIENKDHSPQLRTFCRMVEALGYEIKLEKRKGSGERSPF